jgi:hypothetical protein
MPLVAEWPSGLGKGLQSPVHGFDSRLRLHDFPDTERHGPMKPCRSAFTGHTRGKLVLIVDDDLAAAIEV